ncbi:hypothetical protein AeRB84_014784 [Aphanomyces euteiches]|nr:hypothetical protein AeRB84_014784 [Aphanomyces euteiches]
MTTPEETNQAIGVTTPSRMVNRNATRIGLPEQIVLDPDGSTDGTSELLRHPETSAETAQLCHVPRSNTSYRKSMTSKADTDLLTSKLWNCSTDGLRNLITPRLPIGGLKRTKELRSDPGDKQETP